MTPIHQWAPSGKYALPYNEDDPPFPTFSWAGLELFVDLVIGTNPGEGLKITEPVLEHINIDNSEDSADEHGSLQEAGTPPHDTDSSTSPLLVTHPNNERDCGKESNEVETFLTEAKPETDASKDPLPATHQKEEKNCEKQLNQAEKCGSGADSQTHWTKCTLANLGNPLSPQDMDGDIVVDYDEVQTENLTQDEVNISSRVVTVVEPSSNQEERETGSFSFGSSSDDELDNSTCRGTSSSHSDSTDISSLTEPVSSTGEEKMLESADVARCHLVELGDKLNYGDSKKKSGKRKRDYFFPMRKLSGLIERIYSSIIPVSVTNSLSGGITSGEVDNRTTEVWKDSGRFRRKRIKSETESHFGFEFDEMEFAEIDATKFYGLPTTRQDKPLRQM